MSGTPSKQFIQAKVLKYIQDRPGTVVYLDELCKEFDAKASSVQSVIARAIQNHYFGTALEVEIRGQAWKYHPNKKPTEAPKKNRELFEKIGQAKDGTLILESEVGILYRATEL